jgi:hypothetical protein
MPPKKQHFVPKSYLHGFTDPNQTDRLWVYAKQDDDVRPSVPDNEGYEKYTYQFELADGTVDKTSVEYAAMQNLDNDGARLIARLEAGDQFSAHDRFDLSFYIVMLVLRNPLMMSNMQVLEETARRAFAKAKAEDGTFENICAELYPDYPEAAIRELAKSAADIAREDRYDILFPKGFAMKSFRAAPLLTRALYSMRWTILRAKRKGFFVASDNPVFYGFDDKPNGRLVYGGLAHPKAIVVAPLSRNLALVADRIGPSEMIDRPPTLNDIHTVNDHCIACAKRWIYSPFRSNRIGRDVAARRGLTFELSPNSPDLAQFIDSHIDRPE